jgi:hypothetical protein
MTGIGPQGDACGTKVFLPGGSDQETLQMASRLSGSFPARERGADFDTRHPVMTEDMIRQLPVRRDGTGYAFILRNGLSPVIGRPPVIWRDQRVRRVTRRPPQLAVGAEAADDPAGSALWDAVTGMADEGRVLPVAPVPDPAGWDGVEDDRPGGRERRAWDQIGPRA